MELPAQIDKICPSGFTAQQVLLTMAPDKMVGLAQELNDDQLKIFGEKFADYPVFGAVLGAKDDLNREAVAAAAPQVIIDTGEAKKGAKEDLDALQEQLGIPVIFIEAKLSDYGAAYELSLIHIYIPQSHAPVYDYEVVDVVLMATGNDLKMLATPGEAQLQRAHEALARIGIEHLAHRTYTQISGGEQQLVLIARALAQNAQTIIMDEPTSALDYGNTMRVLSCVRQLAREGLSIVQSTHNPDHAFLYSDATMAVSYTHLQ